METHRAAAFIHQLSLSEPAGEEGREWSCALCPRGEQQPREGDSTRTRDLTDGVNEPPQTHNTGCCISTWLAKAFLPSNTRTTGHKYFTLVSLSYSHQENVPAIINSLRKSSTLGHLHQEKKKQGEAARQCKPKHCYNRE